VKTQNGSFLACVRMCVFVHLYFLYTFSGILKIINYRLYPSCSWDDRVVRRLIGDGKLAARMRGAEIREKKTEVECPICFLYYEQVNSTKCCKAFICTECFLQFNPPPNKKHGSNSSSNNNNNKSCDCPFCNSPELHVQVSARDRNVLKNAEREEEEQKIIEAKIRNEFEEKQKSFAAEDGASSEFGQSLLEHHSSTRKLTSDSFGSDISTPCLASVEERVAIEEEMKHQHLHPLVRRIQEEAEEASNARAQEYFLSNRGRRNRIRERYTDAARSSILLGRHDVSLFCFCMNLVFIFNVFLLQSSLLLLLKMCVFNLYRETGIVEWKVLKGGICAALMTY
jgi:hypothetical protein